MSFGSIDPRSDEIAARSDEHTCLIYTRDTLRPFIGNMMSSAPTARRKKGRASGIARGFVDALAPILGSGRTTEDALAEMDRVEDAIISAFAAQRAARQERAAERLAALRAPQMFNPLALATDDDAPANDIETST